MEVTSSCSSTGESVLSVTDGGHRRKAAQPMRREKRAVGLLENLAKEQLLSHSNEAYVSVDSLF